MNATLYNSFFLLFNSIYFLRLFYSIVWISFDWNKQNRQCISIQSILICVCLHLQFSKLFVNKNY